MTSEYILLLVLSVVMTGQIIGLPDSDEGIKGVLSQSVPKFAIRFIKNSPFF